MMKAVVAEITRGQVADSETPKWRTDSDESKEANACSNRRKCNMQTDTADHKWRTSLAWSAVFRAAGLSIFGLVVWLWLFSADGPPWRAVSLVVVQALAALLGVTWYLPRVRTERRWRAALDLYGEREQAKATSPRMSSRH